MRVQLKRKTVELLVSNTFIDRLDNEIKAIGGMKLIGLLKINDALEYLSQLVMVFGIMLFLSILLFVQGYTLKIIFLILCGPIILMLGQYKKNVQTYKQSIMHDNELPAVIETLAIGVNAGKTLEGTIRYIVANKSGVVRDLLAEAILRVDGGEKLEHALQYIANKSLTRRFDQIVRLLMESKNSTTKLKELLMEQADEIQEDKMNLKLEKAAKLETKLFFPIFLGYFIPVLVMLTYPVLANFKGIIN